MQHKDLYLHCCTTSGVAPLADTWHKPQACPTFRPSDRRGFRVGLGPTARIVSTYKHEEARSSGALVVLRNCDHFWSDADTLGFMLVDFHQLDQRRIQLGGALFEAGQLRPPEDAEAGLLVGIVLAEAFHRNCRVAVTGPEWALRFVESLPGAFICDGEEISCPSRGLVWRYLSGDALLLAPSRGRYTHSRALELAMSMAAPTATMEEPPPEAHDHQRLYSVRFAWGDAPWVPAFVRDDVEVTTFGARLNVSRRQVQQWRLPCSADRWLTERVGKPEAVDKECPP